MISLEFGRIIEATVGGSAAAGGTGRRAAISDRYWGCCWSCSYWKVGTAAVVHGVNTGKNAC